MPREGIFIQKNAVEGVKKELDKWLRGSEKIVLVGIGNEIRRDDFVGVRITKSLIDKVNKNVMIIESETVPESFLEAIVKFHPTHILLIDAGSFGGEPGDTKLVYPTECNEPVVSSHLLPLSLFCGYLQMALEANIALVIIQPKTTDFGEGLSAEVEKTAGELEETLLSLLT